MTNSLQSAFIFPQIFVSFEEQTALERPEEPKPDLGYRTPLASPYRMVLNLV